MLGRSRGATKVGVTAEVVDVEADVASRGVSAFRMVGVPSGSAKGMEQRLLSALRNSGLEPPGQPVTVNFAPVGLAKDAPPLDLALAAALLAALRLVPAEAAESTLFHGELSLDGSVRPASGCLAAAEAARAAGIFRIACAPATAAEAAAITEVAVHPVEDISALVTLLRGEPTERTAPPRYPPPDAHRDGLDLSDVRGQVHAKRALEVAAAGGHGLLLVGPPGSGKSLLARRLPGLLPALGLEESIVVTRIHSAAGLLLGRGAALQDGLVTRRPFRAPHHGTSVAGLVGGGRPLGPGEATLAHHGVLFLDELPEFRRDALEALRQPLEDGMLTVVRAGARVTLPARFLLVAAMNPCPCGWHGSPQRACRCTPHQVERYRARLSGPLLDRIDLQVEASTVTFDELAGGGAAPEPSAPVRERVAAARALSAARTGGANADIKPARLRRLAVLSPEARALLADAVDRVGISARAHDRVLRLALTIADLEAVARGEAAPAGKAAGRMEPSRRPVTLSAAHVGEALSHRLFDRPSDAAGPRVMPGRRVSVAPGGRANPTGALRGRTP